MKFATLTAGLLVLALGTTPLVAHEFKQGALTITHPWARPTPPGLTVTAVYFGIKNSGQRSDRLIGYSSAVAGRTELHETRMDGGMARMREVKSLVIPAHGRITAEPGGLHLMLMDLKQTLQVGQRIPLMLKFERAGTVVVEATVEDAAARAGEDHSHH